MAVRDFDFSGWATRNDVRCSDGRTIRRDAFKDCDGKSVPLVWNHEHNMPSNVLGHAILENRPEGVYAYGSFNETESGVNAKLMVQHGDVTSLSIYANRLKQNGADVVHGMIREVSLVLAGANPGAYIDTVVQHSEDGLDEEEAYIYPPLAAEGLLLANKEEPAPIEHAEETKQEEETPMPDEEKVLEHADAAAKTESDGETVEEVLNTLNEKQSKVVFALLNSLAAGNSGNDEAKHSEEGEDDMKYNVFEGQDLVEKDTDTLTHSEMAAIFDEAKNGSDLKSTCLKHGITDIEYLFPDAKTIDKTPSWIKRPDGWVSKVMSSVKKVPFSRIKNMHADITADEARAKGYVKGTEKIDEVFLLLKRTTDPQTVYKKQKLDRDDILDITDFDVVSWLKSEMRMMLEEELARAFLVGDGRAALAPDKIKPDHIRPIWTDDELYTIHATYDIANSASESDKAVAAIEAVIRARKNYRGSGNPTLYTTEDFVTEALLIKDSTGRYIYETEEQLARKMRVKEIVTATVMEGLSRENANHDTVYLQGIVVNLNDYCVGADKGGAVSMFEDFNIDFNQEKYLIETRCSGALNVPKSAIAIEANFR